MGTGTDRYSRVRRIATGGMGEVWLAHDELLHRDVAVKYLKREYADDEGARTRFLHEARNAAALLHPAIATVFDFGESEVEDGLPYLVMEYVEGRTLADLLSGGRPLDAEQARALVAQAADGLAAAHAIGLVHRDVKPGNLMIRPDGAVKITDFGIARAGDGLGLTETGQLIGTPSYLSPEQASGQSATPASDVYALGVVLFECLTGRRPYQADSPVAIALAHVREPVPDLPAEVPADLAEVTRRAMAKHPEERFADGAAFAAALHALGPEPTMVLTAPVPLAPLTDPMTDPVIEPVTEPVTGAPTAVLTEPSHDVPARQRVLAAVQGRVIWLVLAVLALVGVVGVVAALSSGGDAGQAPPPAPTTTSGPTASATTPATVTVDPAAYVGKPVADVRAALTALGLRSRVETVANPGGHPQGIVATLRPTGSVRVGTTVTIGVWGAVPPPPGKHDGGKHHDGKGKH